MKIGVVSDTHNNYKNIEKIISIFNRENLNLVLHTGDISNSKSLKKFLSLDCELKGVFGNNDREDFDLIKTSESLEFDFQQPPFELTINKRAISIFHEPYDIERYIENNPNIDMIVHGHTHRYRLDVVSQTIIFNPGESAGLMEGKNALGIINLDSMTCERVFF